MINPIKAGFREYNHSKIERLTKAKCSDDTIASAINDEMTEKGEETRFTGADITSYKKFTKMSSKISIVSEDKVRALSHDDTSNPEAILT